MPQFNLYATKEDIPELKLCKHLLDYEGLTYDVTIGSEALKINQGVGFFVCMYRNTGKIGGFYDLVKFLEGKGLRRI